MVVGLKLLGDFQAADSRGQPLQVSSSKGRLLLACLALHQDTGCAREPLAELVWEDRRPEQAQLSLRQELARLRSALNLREVGKWNDKHLLRLPREVSADVASFLAAVAAGDSKAAALSYGGELLAHVAVKTPKLSGWLARKRNELRNHALSSCLSVLFRATDPELDASLEKIAGLAVQLDPFCELAHQWLIRVHASHGNTVLAMDQFRLLNEALHRDGGRQPSEQTVSVLRDMLGRPHQAAAPPPPARATVDWINEINRQHGMAAAPAPVPHVPTTTEPSIAVLPLINLAMRHNLGPVLSDGLTEELTTSLSRIPGLFTTARQSSMVYKGISSDIRKIALELGVRYLVEGSLELSLRGQLD